MDKTPLSEYFHYDRKAIVYYNDGDFWVDMYQNGELAASVQCHAKSELYAENAAENWVLSIGGFSG